MALVLVAEDEAVLLILAESILNEAGYATLTASRPAEALALLEGEGEGEVDLLFTDLDMEQNPMAGIELAETARQLKPGLAVLYTTGGAVTDGVRALLVEGASILSKPYTVPELTGAVAVLLDRAPRSSGRISMVESR